MADSPPHEFSKLAQELIGDLRGLPFDEPRRLVRRPTRTAGDLIEQLLLKHQIGQDTPEHTIRENWPEVVGPANARYSHPATLDARGKLLVLTNHAVVRNEIFLHRQIVLERIQKLPGCAHIKGLNLRAG